MGCGGGGDELLAAPLDGAVANCCHGVGWFRRLYMWIRLGLVSQVLRERFKAKSWHHVRNCRPSHMARHAHHMPRSVGERSCAVCSIVLSLYTTASYHSSSATSAKQLILFSPKRPFQLCVNMSRMMLLILAKTIVPQKNLVTDMVGGSVGIASSCALGKHQSGTAKLLASHQFRRIVWGSRPQVNTSVSHCLPPVSFISIGCIGLRVVFHNTAF